MVSQSNYVELRGTVTRSQPLKYTAGGKAIREFSLAVSQAKKQDGTWPPGIFVDVTLWGDLALESDGYLQQAKAKVEVVGRLSFQSWPDKETGKTRSKLTVTASSVVSSGSAIARPASTLTLPLAPRQAPESALSEDDIPF